MNVEDLVKKIDDEEDMSVPLDINDILDICKEYVLLGFSIQKQVSEIMDYGVDYCISTSKIKESNLPHIRSFLNKISSNPYFGDAVSQANSVIKYIDEYIDKKYHGELN